MNIHVSKLLEKMEEELVKAKSSQTDKEIRERLIVIQSLCEVIIDEKAPTSNIASPIKSEINPAELQKMMGSTLSPVVKSTSRYEEKDANGESLFDF